MSTPLRLPIQPTEPSLSSHIQALDLLSAQLAALTTRTTWPARIPLGSKASVRGELVSPNLLKVNVGGAWWIEMTAGEASEYVQRRKMALLLEHARLAEGSAAIGLGRSMTSEEQERPVRSIAFNPLFPSPVAGPSRPRSPDTGPSSPKPSPHSVPEPVSVDQPTSGKASLSEGSSDAPVSLQDVVETFLDEQQSLGGLSSQDVQKLKGLNGTESMVNEEGLPIHEIREDINGTIIGSAPAPTTNGYVVQDVKELDDYWSDAAKARRAELLKKVFNESSDSDSDNDSEDSIHDSPQPLPPVIAQPSPTTSLPPTTTTTTLPNDSTEPPLPSSLRPPSSPLIPRSILKPPARKKSVSFDDSVPVAPDSPPPTNGVRGNLGFPLPTTELGVPNGEFAPRPVPIIPEPKPTIRGKVAENTGKNSGTGMFAGFKKGFLVSGATGTASTTAGPSREAPSGSEAKRPSLFAQRMAAQDDGPVIEMIDDVKSAEPPTVARRGDQTTNGLPKMSATKGTNTIKTAVVERAPSVPKPARSSFSTERAVPQPAEIAEAGSSTSRNDTSTGVLEIDDIDEDEDEDEEDDDQEEEEEEDEYDLDDALLAREVALDYHRKLAYQSAALREDQDEDEQGGVMLGLPSISNGQIINPTPDDLRKYVRIGKLENGNFILAPGEQQWSDSEDEDVKARREEVKKQLLGQSPIPPKPTPVRAVERDVGLPPAVATVRESTAQHTDAQAATSVAQEAKGRERDTASKSQPQGEMPVEPPKRVSRFKAGRMGM